MNRICLVGKGRFGSVWLVRHFHYGLLALKVAGMDDQECEIISSEAKIMNYLTFLGYPWSPMLYYANDFSILMQYCIGAPLSELLGPVTEDHWWHIAKETAMAVRHLHVYGVAHRDIKTANILYDGCHVNIIDYGLSSRLLLPDGSAGSERFNMAGTPYYMSPELYRNTRIRPLQWEDLIAADIWALGLVL